MPHPNRPKTAIWGTLSSKALIKRQILYTVICYSKIWRHLFTAPLCAVAPYSGITALEFHVLFEWPQRKLWFFPSEYNKPKNLKIVKILTLKSLLQSQQSLTLCHQERPAEVVSKREKGTFLILYKTKYKFNKSVRSYY